MQKLYLLIVVLSPCLVWGQTTATFEQFSLSEGEYLNNADPQDGFSSGKIFLPNYYYPDFESWAGWAISAEIDTTTPGYENQYSAIPGSGVNGSTIYAVSSPGVNFESTVMELEDEHQGGIVEGMYVTNNTYAYLSMLNGDNFAKKFGGPTGDDPDFFRLTVKKYLDGQLHADSVTFYLADYRFSDNSKDYIVDEWTWLDLSALGAADSLEFSLWSSDVGQFGMNTPAYFCVDNVVTRESASAIETVEDQFRVKIFPNPADQFLRLQGGKVDQWILFRPDAKVIRSGRVIGHSTTIDLHDMVPGVYYLKILQGDRWSAKQIIVH